MSTVIASRSTQIPASIEQIWGSPVLLRDEDGEAYKALWIDIANDIEPSGVVEWLWINDILELSWEIRRLRRFKREVIDRTWTGTIGDYFEEGLASYRQLDVLESNAEARRNAVFREVEWRRSVLAGRMRKASDAIIDGHATQQGLPPPPQILPPPPQNPPLRSQALPPPPSPPGAVGNAA
jgi:hypothetical protein